MSYVTNCDFRLHKPNQRYHVVYHTPQIVLLGKPTFKEFTPDIWKRIRDDRIATIPLSDEFDETISDDIGKMNVDGFKLDLKKMELEKKYTISYDGSIYEAYKNQKSELVISEIG